MSEKMTFKQSMNRIDEILEKLEKNDVELEEAITLFEEGLKRVNECDKQLSAFKNKMSQLIESYEGEKHDEF